MQAFGWLAMGAWAWLSLRDASAWPVRGAMALGLCAMAVLAGRAAPAFASRWLLAVPWPRFVAGCALAGAAVSWWVVHAVLRDTPLSNDASVYLLEGRALAHLHLGVPVPRPMQAFAAHFMTEGPDRLLYGVFPPGWPVAIVPFLWLGRPMLVGPCVSGLLVIAQAALGRSVARAMDEGAEGELAARVGVLLGLPSVARAFETADLLSHALVALLAAAAVALALDCRREGRTPPWRAVAIGACLGLAVAARLLDGLLCAALAGVAAGWRASGVRALAWAALGGAPPLALLAIEQRCATGAWLLPTQSMYFARSDWPPGCHRLGLGVDVGCTIEHKGIVTYYGPAGYDWHQALRIVRERAGQLGEDLVSFGPLALLGFLPVALGASAVDALFVAFVLAFTLLYGLFYYGNSPFFGARHLFPLAPFVWLLVARAPRWLPHRAREGWLDAAHVRTAGSLGVLVVALVAARDPWRAVLRKAHEYQDPRSDLRRTLAQHGLDRALVKTPDDIAVAAAVDPWLDGNDRLFMVDDGAGNLEARRAHPDLPVILAIPVDEIGRLYAHAPAPGVSIELERSWPTFVLPRGLGASRSRRAGASGGAVLQLAHAQPGASLAVPFETAVTGNYEVRVDGLAGPTDGDYDLTLDGEPLPAYRGYAEARELRKGEAVERAIAAGRHVLVATCTGHDDRASAYDADLDALVGEPR